MNATLSESIGRIIALADSIRKYWDVELPKHHPDYPLIRSDEDSGPPPPEEQELYDLLTGLPPEDIYRIISVMYLGREDFDAVNFEGFIDYMKRMFGEPKLAIAQMMSKAPLAEYLEDGLAELRKHGIDVDHPGNTPAGVPH